MSAVITTLLPIKVHLPSLLPLDSRLLSIRCMKTNMVHAPIAARPGALVISLDFELHWGVRDSKSVDGSYGGNLRGVWRAIPEILRVFQRWDIAATWATVGFLFAEDCNELRTYHPKVKPQYTNPRLDPYQEQIGYDSHDDPYHFALPLIRQIEATPHQEIACHTYCHFYCLEPGQDSVSFEHDLLQAAAIARSKGYHLRSIVFPRNQCNADYNKLLLKHGITCFRGNPKTWFFRDTKAAKETGFKRALRLLDCYTKIGGHYTTAWSDIPVNDRLCNVPASLFLRPYSKTLRQLNSLRLRRISRAMSHAAQHGRVVHLWWHPHNFGLHLEANIEFLQQVLFNFDNLRRRYGMLSLTMAETAHEALRLREAKNDSPR